MKKNTLIFFSFFVFIIFIVYGNSLNNAFLSDDLAEIVNNPNVSNLTQAIQTHPTGFLRPLFYWIAFEIGGLNPIIFRLINIFFHIGSVMALFLIVSRLHGAKAAFFASVLFAIHPAISEPVVWISGGGYQQYTFFFLVSLLLYISTSKNKLFYFLSIIFYLLSFMSHPVMPLSLFAVFIFYEICFGNLRKNFLKIIPFFTLVIFYLFVSLGALPERENTLQTMHYQQSGIDNPFYTIPVAISTYFQLLIYPAGLTLYHSELSFSGIEFIFKLLITITFILMILYAYKKNKVVFFWGSLFLIALSPTLTPFRLNWIVAERYLYLPSIGIFTILGIYLSKFSGKKELRNFIYSIFAITVILLSAVTITRNIDWKDENHLWIATGKTSPSSPNNHNNLGDVYGRLGDKQRALEEFKTAIALKPNYGDAYHNLANTYRELGDNEKAIENYLNAIKNNPNLWQSYQNIAAIYFSLQQYSLALENIEKAIQINPNNLNLRIAQGVILLTSGQKDKAKELFTMILKNDPSNQVAKQGLIEAEK